MNIDIYSDRAKQTIQTAQSLALASGHQQFAPEHILKALLDERDGPKSMGLSRALITAAGGRADDVAAEVFVPPPQAPAQAAAPSEAVSEVAAPAPIASPKPSKATSSTPCANPRGSPSCAG